MAFPKREIKFDLLTKDFPPKNYGVFLEEIAEAHLEQHKQTPFIFQEAEANLFPTAILTYTRAEGNKSQEKSNITEEFVNLFPGGHSLSTNQISSYIDKVAARLDDLLPERMGGIPFELMNMRKHPAFDLLIEYHIAPTRPEYLVLTKVKLRTGGSFHESVSKPGVRLPEICISVEGNLTDKPGAGMLHELEEVAKNHFDFEYLTRIDTYFQDRE